MWMNDGPVPNPFLPINELMNRPEFPYLPGANLDLGTTDFGYNVRLWSSI